MGRAGESARRDGEPTQRDVLGERFGRVPWRRVVGEALRERFGRGSSALPDRLEGAVYGHLVGHALGVSHELDPPRPVGEVTWRGGGAHGQPAGTWRDDGAVMLALLDSLLGTGFDLDEQGRRAPAWRTEGRRDPGATAFDVGAATRSALDRIAAATPAREAGAVEAKANGSLMRVLPLPLVLRHLPDDELVDLAARASRVTHGSAEAQVACALYVLVTRGLLRGAGDPSRALAGARRDLRATLSVHGLPGSAEAADPAAAVAALDGIEARSGRAGDGRVADSFWSAWGAFAAARDYRDAVTRAVALGRDTDTTAAIAGGLAGIRWGIAGIPAAWRRGLRDPGIARRLVDRLVETAEHAWDGGPWQTSTSSPLRVDMLDLAGTAAPLAGAVGITALPGKRYVGYHTGAHWRDLDTDVARLHALGIDVLLLLVEDAELARCRVADIGDVLPAHGVELVRFPIADPLLPRDGAAFQATIGALLGRVRGGTRLAIACRGGLDRSGLAAGCLLRESGLSAEDAISRVHAARPGSLTLPDQQAYVRRWPPAT